MWANVVNTNANEYSLDHLACRYCNLKQSCLPAGLDDFGLECLARVINFHTTVLKGKQLFQQSKPLTSLYILRSGCVKTWILTESGQETILRFHLPGSILGVSGLNTGHYHATATTLVTCSVCELPLSSLQQFPDQTSVLNHQLLRLVCREIDYDQQTMLLLRKQTARQKIAGFILSIGHRFGQQGYSVREYNFPMSRGEIANHLGVARETLSRVFRSFENEGLLKIHGKFVQLLDRDSLLAICNTQDTTEQYQWQRMLHKENLLTLEPFENRE